MAVCNRFNDLDNASGNFLMFSQYVEDVTCNFVNGDSYKIVPSKFIAMNIDYTKLTIPEVGNTRDLNKDIPKYFQNYYENGCAYGRNHEYIDWTPDSAKNFFWNAMFDGGFLHHESKDESKYVKEIVNIEKIGLHSYNEHSGMGYGEIYCYIPTNANAQTCNIIIGDIRISKENDNTYLEGFTNQIEIGEDYNKLYYYDEDHSLQFDKVETTTLPNYNINTIVVLYDVLKKVDNVWNPLHENIPMGLYIPGTFDTNGKLTNSITKFTNSEFGTGTSYGLRICTRFSVSPNGTITDDITINSDNSYEGIGQLMSKMSENLSYMLDVVKSTQAANDNYKDVLSIFRNNRTNVPYCKAINGVDYWFVNGRLVGTTTVDPSITDDYLDSLTTITDSDLESILSANNF